jgi:hypothetical protein
MNDLLKGKTQTQPPEKSMLLELMERLQEEWLEARMRRIEVIQDLHC